MTSDRRHFCGGTDAAAILGLSPWRSAFEVWAEKRAEVEPEETPETPAQGRGKACEEPLASWYEHEHGGVVAFGEPLHGAEPWMAGSPDRLVHPDSDEDPRPTFGLEVKTATSRQGWGPDGAEVTGLDAGSAIPPAYAAQVLWYLALSGFERWDVVVGFVPWYADGVYTSLRAAGATDEVIGATLDGLIQERRVITVHADADVSRDLLARVSTWWHRHVIDGEPPALDGSDGAESWLFSQHPTPNDAIRDADDEDTAALREWYEARKAKAAADKREATAKQAVEARIGDSLGLAHPQAGIVRWSPRNGARRVDVDKLRAEFPAAAQACTVTGEARRQLDAPRNWTWEE